MYLVVSHDMSTGEGKVTRLLGYKEKDGESKRDADGDKASV